MATLHSDGARRHRPWICHVAADRRPPIASRTRNIQAGQSDMDMMSSVRHILPGFGYFPDDPAGSPMSGIANVAFNLAREAARAGLTTSIVSFSNGQDRLTSTVDGV